MRVDQPVIVVGDVHGQFYDLCHMLENAGSPDDINFLFLGDYVDRGIFGTQIMLVLLSLKIVYP